MPIATITEQDFEREVLRAELPVLLFCTATSVFPCKQVMPEVETLARAIEGKAKVVQVDIDRSKRLASSLRVQTVPAFVVFSKGRPVATDQGILRRAQLQEMLEPFLPSAEGSMSAIELAQLLEQNQVVAIDTRDSDSYARGHVPNARHIPLEELDARQSELQALNANAVLYCATGDKTRVTANRWAETGIPLSYLEGGYLAWEQENLPIDSGSN